MTYLSKDNRSRPKRPLWIIAAGSLFLLLFVLAAAFPNFFSALTQAIGRPLWQTKNAVLSGSSNIFGSFVSKGRLVEEGRMKDRRIEELQNKDMEREVLINENSNLKQILGRKDQNVNLVLGAILTKPPQSPYDTFVIDIGEDHKIVIGNMVLANGDIAIGKISAVFSHTSTVKLFSAGGEKHQVLVGTSTMTALAEGQGGQNYQITLPVGTPVNIGDKVFLPGLRPILLGIVEKLDIKANDSFMRVLFKMSVNVRDLPYVEVETSK